MSRKTVRVFMFLVVVSFLLVVGGNSPFAAGGRVPLYAAGTISAPGSYYLTQNITGVMAVAASNVAIDLNGLTINGDLLLGDGTGLYTNLRAHNGKVQGAVSSLSASYINIDHLQAVTISIDQMCKHAIIERNTVAGIDVQGNYSVISHNTTKMITLRNIGHEVLNNTVNGSATSGIFMMMCAGCKISGNAVNQCSSHGIEIGGGNGNSVDNNTIAYNAGSGIMINSWYNRVTQNQVSGNSGFGIQITGGQDNEVTHNTASMNGTGGIFVDGYYNTISYNSASQNGAGSGIELAPMAMHNVLDWNVASGNGSWGINIMGMQGNIASHNRTANNSVGGLNCPAPNINVYYDSGAFPPVNPTNF